jgi:hypothetical protein
VRQLNAFIVSFWSRHRKFTRFPIRWATEMSKILVMFIVRHSVSLVSVVSHSGIDILVPRDSFIHERLGWFCLSGYFDWANNKSGKSSHPNHGTNNASESCSKEWELAKIEVFVTGWWNFLDELFPDGKAVIIGDWSKEPAEKPKIELSSMPKVEIWANSQQSHQIRNQEKGARRAGCMPGLANDMMPTNLDQFISALIVQHCICISENAACSKSIDWFAIPLDSHVILWLISWSVCSHASNLVTGCHWLPLVGNSDEESNLLSTTVQLSSSELSATAKSAWAIFLTVSGKEEAPREMGNVK